jgi:hypothetical protein
MYNYFSFSPIIKTVHYIIVELCILESENTLNTVVHGILGCGDFIALPGDGQLL